MGAAAAVDAPADAPAPAGRPEEAVGEAMEVEEMGQPVQERAPTEPTPADVEEHDSTGHVQYRTWCHHCVAGRGVGQQHRTRDEEARARDGIPTIFRDYCFMTANGEDDRRSKPILVLKDSKTSCVAATFVDGKGPTPYAVKYFSQFLKTLYRLSSCGIAERRGTVYILWP